MAQPVSHVACDKTANWSLNSLGQTPCLVAAYLGARCSTLGEYAVESLPPGGVYNVSSEHTPCECGTVMYALLSGCAACQLSLIETTTWTFDIFDAPCPSVSYETFPFDIPAGTRVPAWAYQNITANPKHTFNVQQAIQDSTKPDISPTLSNSSPTSTSTQSPTSTSHKSSSPNAGTIAGAVVGSIFALLLLGLGFTYFWRRRRSQRTSSPLGGGGGVKTTPSPGMGERQFSDGGREYEGKTRVDLEGGTDRIADILQPSLTYQPHPHINPPTTTTTSPTRAHARNLSGSTLNATIGSIDQVKGYNSNNPRLALQIQNRDSAAGSAHGATGGGQMPIGYTGAPEL